MKPVTADIKRCTLWFFTVFLFKSSYRLLSCSSVSIKLSRTQHWCWFCIHTLRNFSNFAIIFPRSFYIIVDITDTAHFTCSMILSYSLESCWWLNNSFYEWHLPSIPITRLNHFYSCFHRYHLVLLSSTSFKTTTLTLASGYFGLEINILYYCTIQYCKVKYTKSQL